MEVGILQYNYYIFYRLLNLLCTLLRTLVYKVYLKLWLPKDTDLNVAHVGRILFRLKLSVFDTACGNDFLCLFPGRLPAEHIIYSPYWSLYSVDRRYAYFVELLDSLTEFTVDRHAFLFQLQFNHAHRLARIPVRVLEKLDIDREKLVGVKLAVLSHTARSGSTLLTQMIQASDTERLFVACDTYAFTNLSNILCNHMWSESTFKRVLRICIDSFLATVVSDGKQTLVIKLDSQATPICPIIKELYPDCRILFTHRRDMKRVINSSHRMIQSKSLDHRLLRLLYSCHSIFTWMFPLYTWYDYYLRQLPFRITTSEEFAVIYSCKPYQDATEMRNTFVDETPTYYEDLVENPPDVFARILDKLSIKDADVQAGLECMKKDSQEKSGLSAFTKRESNIFSNSNLQIKIERLLNLLHVQID